VTTPLIGHMVECYQCHSVTVVFDGRHVHEALRCACCPEDHNHGVAASACPGTEAGHPGAACMSGGASCVRLTPEGEPCPGEHCGLRVEGCTVCRPVTIYAMAVIRQAAE
jgi:hypothetical protein